MAKPLVLSLSEFQSRLPDGYVGENIVVSSNVTHELLDNGEFSESSTLTVGRIFKCWFKVPYHGITLKMYGLFLYDGNTWFASRQDQEPSIEIPRYAIGDSGSGFDQSEMEDIAKALITMSTLALDSQGAEYNRAFFNNGGGYKRLPDFCFNRLAPEGVRG